MTGHAHKKNDPIIQLVHDQLGKNINSNLAEAVARHMEECPDCLIYVDSVRQTINLIKNIDAHSPLPQDVENRIFKTLKLE